MTDTPWLQNQAVALTCDLPLWPQPLGIQPTNQIRDDATTSTHLTAESLSAHLTQVLTVHGAAIRRPVDIWPNSAGHSLEWVFSICLTLRWVAGLPRLSGSRCGYLHSCVVVEKENVGIHPQKSARGASAYRLRWYFGSR